MRIGIKWLFTKIKNEFHENLFEERKCLQSTAFTYMKQLNIVSLYRTLTAPNFLYYRPQILSLCSILLGNELFQPHGLFQCGSDYRTFHWNTSKIHQASLKLITQCFKITSADMLTWFNTKLDTNVILKVLLQFLCYFYNKLCSFAWN